MSSRTMVGVETIVHGFQLVYPTQEIETKANDSLIPVTTTTMISVNELWHLLFGRQMIYRGTELG
jgi:hypothetical protein